MAELQRKGFSLDGNVKISGEIYPTDAVPVYANNRKMQPDVFAMKWGYTSKNGSLIINTRSETADRLNIFSESSRVRRCLLPACGYFEWQKNENEKRKFYIHPKHDSLFYLAGIYRIETGKPVFSILTKEPCEDIAFIHERMPVILPIEMKKDWLNMDYNFRDLLAYAMNDMAYVQM